MFSEVESPTRAWQRELLCYLQHINERWSVHVPQDRCDLICIDAPRAETIRARLLSEEATRDAAEKADPRAQEAWKRGAS